MQILFCTNKATATHQWQTLRPVNIIHDSKYRDTFVTESLKHEIEYLNTITLLTLIDQSEFKKKQEYA